MNPVIEFISFSVTNSITNYLKHEKANNNGDHPFHSAEGLLVYHCFFGGNSPQVLDTTGSKEMFNKAGGGHAYGKSYKVAGIVTINVLQELLAGDFHSVSLVSLK